MNRKPKPRLWLVDDESNEIYLGIMRPRIENEDIELMVYAGSGMLEKFMMDYPDAKDSQRDYFLLDVFMAVPLLLRLPKYWGDYPIDYGGTGFALANWLRSAQGVKLGRIRVASAHTNYSGIRHAFGLGELHCYGNWHLVYPKELSAWTGSRQNSEAEQ